MPNLVRYVGKAGAVRWYTRYCTGTPRSAHVYHGFDCHRSRKQFSFGYAAALPSVDATITMAATVVRQAAGGSHINVKGLCRLSASLGRGLR